MLTEPLQCPFCHLDLVEAGVDRLDQSGDTYLPARRWACPGPRCVGTVVIVRTSSRCLPRVSSETVA